MPRRKSPQLRITVPLPAEVEAVFFAFADAQGRSAASAALYLIRLGLKAKERGDEIAWDRPPRHSSGNASSIVVR